MNAAFPRPAAILAAALLVTFAPSAVGAHAGHDHGDAPPPPVTNAPPYVEAVSNDFEIVATAGPQGLILTLDSFATAEPITGATIEVGIDGETITATPAPDGTFRVASAKAAAPGSHELTFAVTAGEIGDLLIGALTIPAPKGDATVPYDPPRRLADGSLYVPKTSQRLLGVRTQLTATTEAQTAVTLVGKVIPDPNFSGHVQASQPGRIEAGDHGLPYLGARVEAGEVLAYVVPALTNVDRGGVQQQIAQIDRDAVIAVARLERLRALVGSVPQKDIDEAKATVEGLRQQRLALIPALTTREALRAPVSGLVAAANVSLGQFVEARDQVLFEILDPAHMMVEAVAYDHAVVKTMSSASATLAGGESLNLTFIGHGATLRQQAMPLLFRIDADLGRHNHGDGKNMPPMLHVGQPVQVFVRGAAGRSGIVAPRESVVRGANGLPQVWEHTAALRFVPRPVRTEPLDGANVLITGGIAAESRIVTSGASLLNQVR